MILLSPENRLGYVQINGPIDINRVLRLLNKCPAIPAQEGLVIVGCRKGVKKRGTSDNGHRAVMVVERLKILPFAKYCVNCQAEIEKRERRLGQSGEEAVVYKDVSINDIGVSDE